jgi:hypothetical protein
MPSVKASGNSYSPSWETVSQFIFVSFRSEASALQFIIPRGARNLGFNKFSTLRFLTEPVLSQILQSPCSFRMTERRGMTFFLITTQSLVQEGVQVSRYAAGFISILLIS